MKDFLNSKEQEMLNLLEKLVNTDSGSTYKKGIDEVGKILSSKYEKLGFITKTVHEHEQGNHLVFKKEDSSTTEIIIAAHMDTVFPVGTANERPFAIKKNRAYGPGVADMKASQVTLLYALTFLFEKNPAILNNVVVLLTSDEEIGSPTSRELIEEYAIDKKYALVMEAARPDGSLVTKRRGSGSFKMKVLGKAAHAGIETENRCSAIEELAQKIVKLHALTDVEKGISVNVGVIEGGTTVNTIASSATAYIDLRVSKYEQVKWLEKKIAHICEQPDVEGTTIELTGGIDRPPMVKNESNAALLEIVKEVGEELGIEITDVASGGGSDASFTSAKGVATIDGLGPIGGNAHTEEEYLEIPSLTERTLLLASVIERLTKLKE